MLRSQNVCDVLLSRRSRCPNCHHRGSLRADYVLFDTFERATVETWQCIYCGAVCEPYGASGHLIVTAIKRITLAPGELLELRKERKCQSTSAVTAWPRQ